ncbi:MAG: hypothetical protein JRF41_11715 [Deltaproteobacteria bacterium]|nr:hypothetical protein [Deltaproteobacteria bacterium]
MKKVSLFLACALWIYPAITHAYTFSPSVITLAPSGNNSSGLISMSNPEDRVIPIDITVYEVTKDIDGKPIQGKEVIDDFLKRSVRSRLDGWEIPLPLTSGHSPSSAGRSRSRKRKEAGRNRQACLPQ